MRMLLAACLNWALLAHVLAGSSSSTGNSKGSPLLRQTPFLMAHEAGTYLMRRGDPNYGARRSQSVSLVDQLSCGVRALDLRLVATAGSSFTQARLWSGDLEPDDEPDPANCTVRVCGTPHDYNPARWPRSPRIVMRCAPRASKGP